VRHQRQNERARKIYSLHAPGVKCIGTGNPYDAHTLKAVIPEIETQVGASLDRVGVERGYRSHKADHKMKIYISGQKRGVTEVIKPDLRRGSAVEPVIGHAKSDHRMDRNFLKGTHAAAHWGKMIGGVEPGPRDLVRR
jgi:transposase, IS5 family